MSSSKHFGVAVIALILVVGLGVTMFAWPAYRDAARIDRQADNLRIKGENYDVQAEVIAALMNRLDEATRRVEEDFKAIPGGPDLAGLMRVLSLPVDGSTLRDQMFKAGESREAAPGSDLATRVAPLTVDMEARFDAIYSLIVKAESMDRLLRVSSVNITCERIDESDQRFARATVVLEAIYEPETADTAPPEGS